MKSLMCVLILWLAGSQIQIFYLLYTVRDNRDIADCRWGGMWKVTQKSTEVDQALLESILRINDQCGIVIPQVERSKPEAEMMMY
jgi:hypothetical protein